MGHRSLITGLIALIALSGTPQIALSKPINPKIGTVSATSLETTKFDKTLQAEIDYDSTRPGPEIYLEFNSSTNSVYARDTTLEKRIRDGTLNPGEYSRQEGYVGLKVLGDPKSPVTEGDRVTFAIKPLRELNSYLKTDLAFIAFDSKTGTTQLLCSISSDNHFRYYQVGEKLYYDSQTGNFSEEIVSGQTQPAIPLTFPNSEDRQPVVESIFTEFPKRLLAEIEKQKEPNPTLKGLDTFVEQLVLDLKLKGNYEISLAQAIAETMKKNALGESYQAQVTAAAQDTTATTLLPYDVPTNTINPALQPPEQTTSTSDKKWYNQWWPWTVAALVVGGATATYIITKDSDGSKTVPIPTQQPDPIVPSQSAGDITW